MNFASSSKPRRMMVDGFLLNHTERKLQTKNRGASPQTLCFCCSSKKVGLTLVKTYIFVWNISKTNKTRWWQLKYFFYILFGIFSILTNICFRWVGLKPATRKIFSIFNGVTRAARVETACCSFCLLKFTRLGPNTLMREAWCGNGGIGLGGDRKSTRLNSSHT